MKSIYSLAILWTIAFCSIECSNDLAGGTAVGTPKPVAKMTVQPLTRDTTAMISFQDQSGIVFIVNQLRFEGFGIEIPIEKTFTDIDAAELEKINEKSLRIALQSMPPKLSSKFEGLRAEELIAIIGNRIVLSIPWSFYRSKNENGLDSASIEILDSLVLPEGMYSSVLLGMSTESKSDFQIKNYYLIYFSIEGTYMLSSEKHPFHIEGYILDNILCHGPGVWIEKSDNVLFRCDIDFTMFLQTINMAALLNDSTFVPDPFLGNGLIIQMDYYTGKNVEHYNSFFSTISSNIMNSGRLTIK